MLAAGSSVQCFDNSTRGLDSSTALDFVKALRKLTDLGQKTTLATLYQAGENIYSHFDKVLLIDQGHQVFFGRTEEAKSYFEDLGFVPMPGETTAEFLTNITDPTQRRAKPGSEAEHIVTPQQLSAAFKQSAHFARLIQEMNQSERQLKAETSSIPSSAYNLSYPHQILECLRREYQLIKGQRRVYYTKLVTTIILSLTVGSLYFDLTVTAQGASTRGGLIFFVVILNGWLQFPELFYAHTNRPVLERQGQSPVTGSRCFPSSIESPSLTYSSQSQSLPAFCGGCSSRLDRLTTNCLPARGLHHAFLLLNQTPSRCRKVLLLLLDFVYFDGQLQ